MYHLLTAILLVSRALAEVASATATPATTRAPRRTLDRQSAELAWRSWLQSPESGNQNAPPRRITTKSLFITPLVCPKGQRLDRNGCVQVVTVNREDHEAILLEQLNALFTSAPSTDVVYDYGDEEPGPLQLSIPIGLDPQAAPLQAEPPAQTQDLVSTYVKNDKKDKIIPTSGLSLEAELELLQLQHSDKLPNETVAAATTLNHVSSPLLEKPKRNSPDSNSTEVEATTESDEGQKELFYGHVNVDPVLYHDDSESQDIDNQSQVAATTTAEILIDPIVLQTNITENSDVDLNKTSIENKSDTLKTVKDTDKKNYVNTSTTAHVLKDDNKKTKLNPESDYAEIGEAIKLISRYAEVTTDDNFTKSQNKSALNEDSILGTRTRLQHRRKKPRPTAVFIESTDSKRADKATYVKNNIYYRYPWQGQHPVTPPPDYPFRHIQDYWPGRNRLGGVYNFAHENPRRHHHQFVPNYVRPRDLSYMNYPASYTGQQVPLSDQQYLQRAASHQHHTSPVRLHDNQDLYSLLGLRHWFSSGGTSKR